MSDEERVDDVKQVIVVRKDLNMRKGKLAAQCGHSVLEFLVENNEAERPDELYVKLSADEAQWLFSKKYKKIVVGVDSEDELNDLILKARLSDVSVYPITDMGLTEFHGIPTLTCASFGPCKASIVDEITGHLKPL